MNSSVTKSLRINDSEFLTGSCKKQRRRHRNRYKNYILKKKKLRKTFSTSRTGSLKSDIFNYWSNSEKIMSNWYWSNYRKALEWQERHKVAQWKACALALLEENRYLLEIINKMQPSVVSSTLETGKGTSFSNKQMRMKYSEYFPTQSNNNEEGSYSNHNNGKTEVVEDDFEFEMSEEMMQFFEESYKHKMDMNELNEKKRVKNTDEQVEQIQGNKIKRSTEMNCLYGEGASMITGMETAVQLSFNKYCDNYTPKYWPNIPFRL